VAVSSYQNPLEYQMYSAFENKEEDAALTTTQTELPRSSLDILQSAGVQPTGQTGRAATDILKSEGVTSAKDILRSGYFEKPDSLLDREGISAASILEDYRKEQAAFRQQQKITDIATKAEEDLSKKEQEFIKSYKYNVPQAKESVFETKYGTLDFNKGSVSVRFSDDNIYNNEKDRKESVVLNYEESGKKYVYLPEEFVVRGKEWGTTKTFNYGFLNQEALKDLYTMSQPMDASNLGAIDYNDYAKKGTAEEVKYEKYPGIKVNDGLKWGRGFLFEEKAWTEYHDKYLKDKFIDTYSFSDGNLNFGGIKGIADYNGTLVYVKDNVSYGGFNAYNMRIGPDGVGYYDYTKKSGGVRGAIQEAGKTVASIPFAPEIAFIASSGNPAVYATMKALQVNGQGGDFGDIVKAGATAYVTASVGAELQTYGNALGESIVASTGVSATVGATLGNAAVNAAFNGFVAAATGKDVGDAMLTGAISGGIGANAADITNAVFGGAENVAALSKTLNLTTKQTQTIFAGALVSGSVNSVVKNESFMDAFTESLIVQGVSQAGANAVTNSLKTTMSPKAVKAIESNTRIMLQATARAAVRGEDIETALARVAPYLQGRAIGQTVNILASKKD
jgi:hypothetical protein